MPRPQLKSVGIPAVRPGQKIILAVSGRRFNPDPQDPTKPTIRVQIQRFIGNSGQVTAPASATILLQRPDYLIIEFVVPTHFTDSGSLISGDEIEITVTNLDSNGDPEGEDSIAYP